MALNCAVDSCVSTGNVTGNSCAFLDRSHCGQTGVERGGHMATQRYFVVVYVGDRRQL